MTYAEFLARKSLGFQGVGIDCEPSDVSEELFEFQRQMVAWAVRKGCAAIWADTGLGKTRMQVEWARIVTADGGRALILAPLAVASQTVEEAERIGVDVTYVRDQAEADRTPSRIVITNYDRLHLIDPGAYRAVVLDESSILKSFSGSTKRALVHGFDATHYRLSCSATPAPNDIQELCNHADFLGVMSPQEMRSTFFIADNRGEFMRYRLKGHAKDAFYRWMSSWAIACRTPSDLGYDDDGYILPPLSIDSVIVDTDWVPEDVLFTAKLEGITQRSQVRKATLEQRVQAAVELVAGEPDEQWLLWCGLNDEADALTAAIPDAVQVAGSDDSEVKSARLSDFAHGRIRVLVTKPSIAGMGLNFQTCARMAFVGLSDSYEAYYQAIRRCYRFGQTRPVHAWVVLSAPESTIYNNVLDKERIAQETSRGLVAAVADHNRSELFAGTSKGDNYEPTLTPPMPAFLEVCNV
jgi:hypothetical protein